MVPLFGLLCVRRFSKMSSPGFFWKPLIFAFASSCGVLYGNYWQLVFAPRMSNLCRIYVESMSPSGRELGTATKWAETAPFSTMFCASCTVFRAESEFDSRNGQFRPHNINNFKNAASGKRPKNRGKCAIQLILVVERELPVVSM